MEKAESTTYDSNYYHSPNTQTLPAALVTVKLEEPETTKLKFVVHHLHPGSCDLLREVDTLCQTNPSGWESRLFSSVQQVESCVISLRHAASVDTKMGVDPWIIQHCKADEELLEKLSLIFRDRVMTFSPSEDAKTLMAWAQALMICTHSSFVSIRNQLALDPSTRKVVGTLKLGDLRSCSVVFHPLKDSSLSCPLQVTTLGVKNHWRSYTLHHSHPSRSQVLQKIFKLYQHQPSQLPAIFHETLRALKTCSDSLKQLSKGEGLVIKDPWLRLEYKADKAMVRFLINLGLKLSGTKTGD